MLMGLGALKEELRESMWRQFFDNLKTEKISPKKKISATKKY